MNPNLYELKQVITMCDSEYKNQDGPWNDGLLEEYRALRAEIWLFRISRGSR